MVLKMVFAYSGLRYCYVKRTETIQKRSYFLSGDSNVLLTIYQSVSHVQSFCFKDRTSAVGGWEGYYAKCGVIRCQHTRFFNITAWKICGVPKQVKKDQISEILTKLLVDKLWGIKLRNYLN